MFMYSSRVYEFFNNIIVIIVFYQIYWEHVVYYRITDYKGKSEDFQCLFVDMASASISIDSSGEIRWLTSTKVQARQISLKNDTRG
jgi:hypothetical protein